MIVLFPIVFYQYIHLLIELPLTFSAATHSRPMSLFQMPGGMDRAQLFFKPGATDNEYIRGRVAAGH
jgi:hypothetical protein